jgi:hypothetical protein
MSFKIPDDISCDDVYQWLNDSYVLHDDGHVLQFTGDVERTRHGGRTAYFINVQEGDAHAERLNVKRVSLHWPVCGAINVSFRNIDYAYYVQRNQRRQWRRAFNPMCVSVKPISGWALHKASRDARMLRLGNEQIVELFDPTYYSAAMAMRKIQGGAISVALSPQVTLAGDGKGQYTVYYRTTLVGGLRDGVFTPTVTDSYGSDIAEQMVMEVHSD